MKNKLLNIIIDIILITAVFAITDLMVQKVFRTENIWLELGVYIIFYGIVFGMKRGIIYLWKGIKK